MRDDQDIEIKNVDIQISAHNAFLELPSSGTLWETKTFKVL